MSVSEASIQDALKQVTDPNTGKDFVTSRSAKNIKINGADVALDIELGYPAQSQLGLIRGMLPTLLAHSVVCAPYVIRTVQASAMRLDRNLEDSALSLGAKPGRVLWDVTLPLLKPGLLSGGIMAFVISFDNVTISLFLSAPGATTLPALLFNQASETGLNTTLAAVCAISSA